MTYEVPEHDRPLTPAQARVLHVLGDQILNDGYTTTADLLALLIEADAYRIDLDPVGVLDVLSALRGLGLVEVEHCGWRVVMERPDPVAVVVTKNPKLSMTYRARKRRKDAEAERDERNAQLKAGRDERNAQIKAARKQPGSPTPKDVPMFNCPRKTVAETKTVPMSAAAMEAERIRLGEKFHGPGHAARRALEGDPVLTERLDAALDAGLEIDLTDVPKFRRGAYVEEALAAWETARKNGPCAFCGTATSRRGQEVVRYVPGVEADETHPWAVWQGQTVCQWCRHGLAQYGEQGLRGIVFRAAASLRSPSWSYQWVLDPWVPWWSELAPEVQDQHRRAGKPWGHVNVAAARSLAADLLPRVGGLYAVTQGQVEQASIPGLEARAWTVDEMPKPGETQFVLVGVAASQGYQREQEAWAEKRRKDAKQAAAHAEWEAQEQARRSAEFNAMTETEQESYEQRAAMFVAAEVRNYANG